LHPLDEDLELYFLLRFSPHHISSVESHVSECELCQEKIRRLAESRRDSGKPVTEWLRDMRALPGGSLSIRVLETSPVAFTGRILDVHENEVILASPDALLPGTFLQIRIGSRIILGQVRSCAPSSGEFLVSVEIQSIFLIPRGSGPGEGR